MALEGQYAVLEAFVSLFREDASINAAEDPAGLDEDERKLVLRTTGKLFYSLC